MQNNKWYHVSRKDLGDKIKLTPKIPESAIISREGNIPRVTTSDNVLLCVKAIISSYTFKVADLLEFKHKNNFINPAIYVNDTDQPYLPPDAIDFRSNNEHWYLQETEFNLIGYVCLKSLTEGKLNIVNEKLTLTKEEFKDNKHKKYEYDSIVS